MRKKIELEKEIPKLPSVATLSSIISGLMSQEVIKIILELGKTIKNYLFYDGLYNSFTELELKRNDNCPICGENVEISNIELSYAFKLMLDEFKTLGIYPKLELKNKY